MWKKKKLIKVRAKPEKNSLCGWKGFYEITKSSTLKKRNFHNSFILNIKSYPLISPRKNLYLIYLFSHFFTALERNGELRIQARLLTNLEIMRFKFLEDVICKKEYVKRRRKVFIFMKRNSYLLLFCWNFYFHFFNMKKKKNLGNSYFLILSTKEFEFFFNFM